jgi:hypothetical protein
MKSNDLIFFAVLQFALVTSCYAQPEGKHMKVSDAKSHFEAMLRKAGVNFEKTDILECWNAFKQFAKLPVACQGDRLLFECSVSEEHNRLYFHFMRQFIVNEKGEYDHLEFLNVSFHIPLTPELKKFQIKKWSVDFASLDEFFRYVEGLKQFREVVGKHKPSEFHLTQERT